MKNKSPVSGRNKRMERTAVLETAGLPEILFITSYPPRECGIATYSHDLVKALNNKFSNSFKIRICALESESERHDYAEDLQYVLNTDHANAFIKLADAINANAAIRIVMIQHEFGFFNKHETDLELLLERVEKPVILTFHTVLPDPGELLKKKVQAIAAASEFIIVMTNYSAKVLVSDYDLPVEKITVIPHGTHLVPHTDKKELKEKYRLSGKTVLSTFGLLSSGKSIETTLDALPAIVELHPAVVFLIIGKTHPGVVKHEEEKYRKMLESKVTALGMEHHVQFINCFLPLTELLEYLQLTDIYLFTSKDPNQAVSGTFSYAISCGCPVVSTPIPHAREVLRNDAGIIIDFENPQQLSAAVIMLLDNEQMRKNISSNGLHRIASTAWENAAIAHAFLFAGTEKNKFSLRYNIPPLNLDHIKNLTTDFGMVQFSKINKPDIDSGYTLDDNARALIAMCRHFEQTLEETNVKYIYTYFNFIKYCLLPENYFLNYADKKKEFTEQNSSTNLADANGRAIWALGYLVSMSALLPKDMVTAADELMKRAVLNVNNIHSTRAMGFVIKGLHYYNLKIKSPENSALVKTLANRLLQMYRHEARPEWQWFESYMTYANSILSEAMLCAFLVTGDTQYKETAKTSFDFLLAKTFKADRIKIISNKTWLFKGNRSEERAAGGEQPIDVAYTIIALGKFYEVFKEEEYLVKMKIAFDWFLGNNHLHQVIYNPCTGGCYDGLEENYVNLNQGAESTLSYLIARQTVEKYFGQDQKIKLRQVVTNSTESVMV